MAGAPDNFHSDFILASLAMHITDTPSIPAPTAHTVASFTAAGPLIQREKTTGPWKNPGRSTPPYPHVQHSRDLMSRLGVIPTIQTLKEFEGIVLLEEVIDEAAGAPTVKLEAYALSDPPRAPTPEMAPLLDRMVIDMLSDNEGDTVSLREEGDIVPADSNLFGSLIPQGLKLDIDNDDSDYGEDPERLCGPIIEPAPSQISPAPLKHKWTILEGYTGTKGMSSWSGRWSDDHDTYKGPTDNELVPFCSHKGTLLTDPSTAFISIDIGRSLDKYLAYEQLYCRFVMHCADCKEKTQNDLIPWVVDSGASVHFTGDKSNFSELKLFTENERPLAQTVNGAAVIHGSGTVFIKTYVDNTPNKMMTTISCLSLVFYMPGVGTSVTHFRVPMRLSNSWN